MRSDELAAVLRELDRIELNIFNQHRALQGLRERLWNQHLGGNGGSFNANGTGVCRREVPS